MLPRVYCRVALSELDRRHLDAFVAHLRVTGLAAGTCRVYGAAVARWLGAGGLVGHLDALVLLRWLGDRRRLVSQASINGDLKALRRFYGFAAACGHCAPGTADLVPKQRAVPARLARVLTVEQVAAVLTAPDPSSWLGYRDMVLLRALCDTGLRTGELAALQVGSVLADGMLYVSAVKRRPARYVPISAELGALLDRYIERRREVRAGKRSVLWVTCHGHALQPRTICHLVNHHMRVALGRALGCDMLRITGRPWQGQYPHLLRASLAQHYLERGLDAVSVAQLLGYSDVASVMRYAGVDLTAMRAAIARHPRGSKPK